MRTPEHVEYMALPRMCALAEVLWGRQSNETYGTFEKRLVPHLAKLKSLGYNFRPIQPEPPTNYVRIGSWEQGQLSNEPRELAFVMPTPLNLSQGFSISVNYGGGFYGVFIDSVEIRTPEGAICTQVTGASGNQDEGNIVHFAPASHPVEVVVTMRSKGTSDTEGNIYVVLP